MKAVRFHEHGGPEVLRYEEAPDPTPRPSEVLLRVKAVALNHLDVWLRKGLPGMKVPLPKIGGCDIAGEVVSLGAMCSRITVGQRILVSPGISCGQCAACLRGDDNLCRGFKVVGGYVMDGGCADFVCVPEVNCLPLPRLAGLHRRGRGSCRVPDCLEHARHSSTPGGRRGCPGDGGRERRRHRRGADRKAVRYASDRGGRHRREAREGEGLGGGRWDQLRAPGSRPGDPPAHGQTWRGRGVRTRGGRHLAETHPEYRIWRAARDVRGQRRLRGQRGHPLPLLEVHLDPGNFPGHQGGHADGVRPPGAGQPAPGD